MPTTRTTNRFVGRIKDEPKPSREANAIKNRVMPLLLEQHNVAALGAERQPEKIAKLEGFVDRAIRDGLTLKLVEENLAAGRPPHFIEGEHSPEPASA